MDAKKTTTSCSASSSSSKTANDHQTTKTKPAESTSCKDTYANANTPAKPTKVDLLLRAEIIEQWRELGMNVNIDQVAEHNNAILRSYPDASGYENHVITKLEEGEATRRWREISAYGDKCGRGWGLELGRYRGDARVSR